MTVEELFSLQADDNKLRSLYIELARHEDFNPYKGNIITDMPKGSGAKNFSEWYIEEEERIKSRIEYYKKKVQEDRAMIEEYIKEAPYPESDIIRYRAINNLSWEDIGGLIGYSRQQAAKKFWKYVKEEQKERNAHGKL